jgi:hypothetical protein
VRKEKYCWWPSVFVVSGRGRSRWLLAGLIPSLTGQDDAGLPGTRRALPGVRSKCPRADWLDGVSETTLRCLGRGSPITRQARRFYRHEILTAIVLVWGWRKGFGQHLPHPPSPSPNQTPSEVRRVSSLFGGAVMMALPRSHSHSAGGGLGFNVLHSSSKAGLLIPAADSLRKPILLIVRVPASCSVQTRGSAPICAPRMSIYIQALSGGGASIFPRWNLSCIVRGT